MRRRRCSNNKNPILRIWGKNCVWHEISVYGISVYGISVQDISVYSISVYNISAFGSSGSSLGGGGARLITRTPYLGYGE